MIPNLRVREWSLKLRGLIAANRRPAVAVVAAGVLIAIGGTVALRAALEGSSAAGWQLMALLPQGAMLTIESKDFAGLLKRWNTSPEEAAWLKSDNYGVFSRSRLYSRLGDAQTEFAQAAGLPPDAGFLNEVAGKESVFAWYDIGKLEFLYITRMPSGAADKTRLVDTRGKFRRRQIGTETFYVRTVPDPDQSGQPDQQAQGEPRTVAFATSGDLLLLATREDLMAGALTLLAANSKAEPGSHPSSAAEVHPLVAEQWFVDARAAAAHEAGDLRMTLNLEKIVPSPYFRSYWVQKNITEMKQYRGAVADLYLDAGKFREDRVLLPRTSPQSGDSSADLAALTALAPEDVGVFRAEAAPAIDATVASVNEKLLQRGTGSFTDSRIAPDADLTVQAAGAASDYETRIDAAPLSEPAKGEELASLRQVLLSNGLQAAMTVSQTGNVADGVFVPFKSAVVLESSKPWDQAAMETALQQAAGAHLTAGGLGLSWKTVKDKSGSYLELSETRPLEMAVKGRLCILTDDPALMQQMLARLGSSTPGGRRKKDKDATGSDASGHDAQAATLIAGASFTKERESFARWSSLVDRTNGQTTPAGNAGSEPAFFSQNMRGLSDVFSALESERLVERRDGELTRQTVTYAWRQ